MFIDCLPNNLPKDLIKIIAEYDSSMRYAIAENRHSEKKEKKGNGKCLMM
jgi:hypothetical protein